MSEEYVKTNKGWNHKFRKTCPHCNLPLDIQIFVPELPPKPTLTLKGAVKTKPMVQIDWKNEKISGV